MSTIAELPTPPPSVVDLHDVPDKTCLDNVPIASAHSNSPIPLPRNRYQRKMGETELSYFLPSRQSGVNDMSVPL